MPKFGRYPVRAGVYSTGAAARDAVYQLREAGFAREEITVVCTEKTMHEQFPEKDFPHEMTIEPSGHHTSAYLTRAGIGALVLGVVAVITVMLTTTTTAILVIGALAGVVVAGTFISTMATRATETEAADYHDQAIQSGKILVAVEVPGNDKEAERKRNLANSIITSSGAHSLPLSH